MKRFFMLSEKVKIEVSFTQEKQNKTRKKQKQTTKQTNKQTKKKTMIKPCCLLQDSKSIISM